MLIHLGSFWECWRGELNQMPQLIERDALTNLPRERDKAVKILAKSLFRDLKSNGYDVRQIVALSSELISLVTTDFRPEPPKTDE